MNISCNKKAFTLIELITVIAIILILMGLLFPALNSVKLSAQKLSAKSDVINIVNAVKAFNAEYGQYPTVTTGTFGVTTGTNALLIDVLRTGTASALNPRGIVFLEAPIVKDRNNPKSGIGTNGTTLGTFYDPWGSAYQIIVDVNYTNTLPNPYNANTGAGPATISGGIIAWSLGRDKTLGLSGSFTNSDDVISWQ